MGDQEVIIYLTKKVIELEERLKAQIETTEIWYEEAMKSREANEQGVVSVGDSQ